MTTAPRNILRMTAEYRTCPDDPAPTRIEAGGTMDDWINTSDDVADVVRHVILGLTVDWDGFDKHEFVATLARRLCGGRPKEMHPDYAEYHAEDAELNEMVAAAERYLVAKLKRERETP